MSHLLHNRALHDGAVKVGFGSLLLICIGAPSGGDTSTPAPTISLLLPFIRRSHIMVQRHLAAEHWVVKRLSVAMQALKIRFRLFRPFSHSRDTFETLLQMVWHPSSLLKFHVFFQSICISVVFRDKYGWRGGRGQCGDVCGRLWSL